MKYYLKTDFLKNEVELKTKFSKDCKNLITVSYAREHKTEELSSFLLKRTNIDISYERLSISEFFAIGYLENIIFNSDKLILNWKIEKVFNYRETDH